MYYEAAVCVTNSKQKNMMVTIRRKGDSGGIRTHDLLLSSADVLY